MSKKRKYGDAWKNVTVAKSEVSQMDSVFNRFFETDKPVGDSEVASPFPKENSDPGEPVENDEASAPFVGETIDLREHASPDQSEFGNHPGTIAQQTMVQDKKTIVPQTTVVWENKKPLSETTVIQQTTVVPQIQVPTISGYLQIPNSIVDGLLPQLPIHEQIVYLRLFRLSYGFRSSSCKIGFDRLSTSCNLSKSAVIRAVEKLEARGIIKRLEADFGCSTKTERGNIYEVRVPEGTIIPGVSEAHSTTVVRETTVVPQTTYKEKRFDLYKKNHHQSKIEMIYRSLTGNDWTSSDDRACQKLSVLNEDVVIDLMKAIHSRTTEPIGSFAYFVKAIEVEQSPGKGELSRKAMRVKYEKWMREIRSLHVGDNDFRISDMVYELKRRCIREGIRWDDDVANDVLDF